MTGEPQLAGQTVVVIGGSSGIGLETARRPAPEGAGVILAGRDADRLKQAAAEVGARAPRRSTPPTRPRSSGFFARPAGPVDHVLVTGPGPYYAPLAELDRDRGQPRLRTITSGCPSPWPSRPSAGCGPAARCCSWAAPAAAAAGPGCRSSRRTPPRCPPWSPTWRSRSRRSGSTSSRPASSTRPLSATLLGADLDKRRAQLRATLPIRRVVEPGRRRRARGAPDDQHRGHGRDLRHRRWPATRFPESYVEPDRRGRHHHRRLQGHRRGPGGRVPRARLGGGGQRPQDQAVGSR